VALLAVPAFSFPPYLNVYRCADDSLLARIPTYASEWAMPVLWNPRLNHLYVSGYNALYVVDCSTDMIVDTENSGLALNIPAFDTTDNKLYCPVGQNLAVYDCAAESIVATIPLPYHYFPHVVWSPGYNKVYVSFASDQSSVMVIDCEADSFLKYIPVVGGAREMCAWGPDKVYFAGDHSVGVIDVATDSFVSHTHLPDSPTWLALNPATDRLVIQDWWSGTFIYDCIGDTLVDSLPYNVAGFGGIDLRKNQVYLCLSDGVCAVDMETGSVVDTILDRHVGSMVLDTIDNKGYAFTDGSDGNDTIWVVDTDSARLLRMLQTEEYGVCNAVWSSKAGKVYVGAFSPVPGVEFQSGLSVRAGSRKPTVLRAGAGLNCPPSSVVFDAMGRRVVSPKSGVYFVRQASGVERDASGVTKVVIQH
jgi:DNA-binding beta-propeller fold protein YncE